MTSVETQLRAVEAAARYYSGRQSGPKPSSKEGVYLAGLLDDAARTLQLVAEHRDEFAEIVKAERSP